MIRFYKKTHLIGVFLLLLCMGNPFSLKAQDITDISNLEIEEYTNLSLPPLDVLFENAKTSPNYEISLVQEEMERRLLKKEQRSFLGFFSIRGSWQYGNFTNDASYSDIVTPIINSYNKAEQTSYSVGAGISIPLDQLFDLRAKVKRQKLNVKTAELQKELKFQEIKKGIIEIYATAMAQLNMLKLRAEEVILANTQYIISERNFTNGTITSEDLTTQKEKQSGSLQRYETTKFELSKNIMLLEIITNTSIIKKH